jgi:hypothetical protein
MAAFGLYFALYSVSTFLFYCLWLLLKKPLWLEKVRDYGNLAAIFLPFLMFFARIADYIPHGVGYVAYMQHFFRISDSYRKIEKFYDILPFVFFLFILPIFRKSWKISLIISLVALPVIDLDSFSMWLYDISDDFYRANSTFDETAHMAIFARRFAITLCVLLAFLLPILIFEKGNKT